MQYHLNGYRSGDPSIASTVGLKRDCSVVDVLIIGCGPAGLTLAAQLATFPDISTRIIESKSGPLEVGQADGIACRSMEMFEAFGFAEKVRKEAYQVNEVTFWRPDTTGTGIMRVDRIQDVEDDLSEMPHLILNQARVHDFLLEKMRNSPTCLIPDYDRELMSLTTDNDFRHPVTATVKCLDQDGRLDYIKARFVIGCDGAHSKVRQLMGYELKGEASRQLWGVMDVLAITDFPDIRLKCAIQSADKGSILIIPREGGYMFRMYIELDELQGDERAADRRVNAELLSIKAKEIMSPFTLDIKDVVWWSAYEIGQRVCDAFDDVPDSEREIRIPQIFIAGDACHTHSPKAGQGMNVSMADGFNLGWKLAAVLMNRSPSSLLHTYSEERCAMAKELIAFDKDMARLFSARPTNEHEAMQFQQYFKKHGRYTAGVETRYSPSQVTGNDYHQSLASGLVVGKRFHSAPVVRLSDAKPVQLGHVLKADGRWRLIAFAAEHDIGQKGHVIAQLCHFLAQQPGGLIRRVTPSDKDIDNVIDLRVVFQTPHRDLDISMMPELLLPGKGKYQLIDYEKVFCADCNSGNDIFKLRGIDRHNGVMVIVRPDQYVAKVLPLEAFQDMESFFSRVLIPTQRLEKR